MNRFPQLEEHTACDVCHRTMLKGEWAEPYLTPSRERRLVCQLCAPHAQREGWIRESAAPEAPAQPQRPPERRGLFRRRSRRREADPLTVAGAPQPERERHDAQAEHGDDAETNGHDQTADEPVFTRLRKRAGAPRRPRQVRAVPTNAQLKIGRALDLFNRSEHPRTIAGIARSLGPPNASAQTSEASAAEVILTVAWELSWYQFAVDLSDPREPVQLRAQGQELHELSEEARGWNLEVDGDGRLSPPSAASGDEAEPVGVGVPGPHSGGEEFE